MLLSDKVDWEYKITKDKAGHFRMTNGSIYQEDTAILNVHVPNSFKKKKKLPKKPTKKSERAKRRNRPTVTLGDFNSQLLVIGRIIN